MGLRPGSALGAVSVRLVSLVIRPVLALGLWTGPEPGDPSPCEGITQVTEATGKYRLQDLQAMLSDIESDRVKRNESIDKDRIRQAVCAFANDLPDHRQPGFVFVGADDLGHPVGLDVSDELLRNLADIRTDGNIVPPPTLTVTKHLFGGKPVAVVAVTPSDAPPVRYKGRIWIRVGPRRAIASPQDERILNEKRRYLNTQFDAQPVSEATESDLDLRRFEEEYLPRAVDAETLAANQRSSRERLASTKMIVSVDDPRPTIAGILVLGKRPQDFLPNAYVQFLRIRGSSMSDEVIDERRCTGSITELIGSLDDKLTAHNRIAVDFTSGPVESRTLTYPIEAMQQLARNAIMHRTYEDTNSPVRFYWFDDRIEITSPGGPYGIVSAENFGIHGMVDYRNQILAEAMRVLGFAQRFGAGIPIARTALLANRQSEPEFSVQPNSIQCTLRACRR